MNKQPIMYMQTDPKWADKPYYASGGYNTIGKSGCGPTCAAMLIATLTGKQFTPVDACKWAVEHGHRTANQGTAYSYFEPQFAAHGIACKMLNWQNTYGKPDHANHKKAFDLLKEGYYLIAVMGKGLWTSSGHFVVVWWEDGWVHINDPASKATARIRGNRNTFKRQVKYYWYVDARKHNSEEDPIEQVDDDMFTYEQFKEYQERYEKEKAQLPPSDWSKDAREWAEGNGIINGDADGNKQYKKPATREELVQLLYNMREGG